MYTPMEELSWSTCLQDANEDIIVKNQTALSIALQAIRQTLVVKCCELLVETKRWFKLESSLMYLQQDKFDL